MFFLFGHVSTAYANHRGISWIVFLCIAFDLVSRENFSSFPNLQIFPDFPSKFPECRL